ncbi:MAG: nickel pincer cofactor biosynthesis protein LarC [Selenomonadaceae bacterium]|nr:nickel pincer cofactor biosynthesis protein LarC [Selenomonadaceae bacterium]MBR4695910.1 nickel pincer cofactor biosynthesis protein LarC [Selenomonadaceae bacterium]
MKAIYLDCFSGISGNMLLGAFLQAGVPQAHLEKELRKLPVEDEYLLHVDSVARNGIQAVHVDVELTGRHMVSMAEHAAHHHGGDHHHEHHHGEEHHHHRTMASIRAMLEKSALESGVKQKSLAVFEILAEAEGKVHGKPKDEVAFHEVGAVDSIVDVVGTAICMEYLDIGKVFVSKLNTGSGFVQCAHGLMPVPAPAVAELLKGLPSYHRGAEKELTTPTGAAVVKAMAEYEENLPEDFTVERIAYGAGTWELEIPNVLRMYLGEYRGARESKCLLLETNIDDMNPQIYGYLYECLLEAGAMDVWTTGIYMKKNRPAQKLSVLVDEAHRDACADIVFRETTSIGLRVLPVGQRIEAVRRIAKVQTKYGNVDCKISAYRGHIVSVSPEYEDCREIAAREKVPLKQVQQEALRVLAGRLGE